jgi:hypothetical protein
MGGYFSEREPLPEYNWPVKGCAKRADYRRNFKNPEPEQDNNDKIP